MLCLSRAPSDQVLGALRASQTHREGLTSSLCQDTEHLSGSIAELLSIALGMPAKRGARLRLCRLQPRLQVVEYLPCFSPPKFPVQTFSFLPCPWNIILILPAAKGSLERYQNQGCNTAERGQKDWEAFPLEYLPFLQLSYHQTHCKRVLRGRLVTTPK